jgi:hypothetical protein
MESQHVSTTDKDNQSAVVQNNRTSTTTPVSQTQPLLIAGENAFVAALRAVSGEDWYRTWTTCRTIILTRTSKEVKEQEQKLHLYS